MIELKSCPFCGGEGEIEFTQSFPYTDEKGKEKNRFYYTVRCKDVFCGCRIGVYEHPGMAVEAWNRRVNNDIDQSTEVL